MNISDVQRKFNKHNNGPEARYYCNKYTVWLENELVIALQPKESAPTSTNNRSDEIAFIETLFAITHCKSEIDRVLNARIAQLRAVR